MTGQVTYCPKCKRIKGIGCACGVPFKDRIRSVSAQVPDHMRAVPRS